jgi:hypothetical protein
MVSPILRRPLSRKRSVIKRLADDSLEAAIIGKLRFAWAFIFALALSEFGPSHSVSASELGPFFWVQPPTVQIEDRPKPLYAPYGYYGPQGGCVRQPFWRGNHWKSVTVCRR